MARSVYIREPLTGMAEISAALQGIPEAVKTRIMSTALRAAARPLVVSARAYAPRRTGALRRSISSVIRKYRQGQIAVAVVGPDKGYYNEGKRAKKGQRGKDRPANYAHLVEFGHVIKPSGRVLARPFMRPAVLVTSSKVGESMVQGVAKGIERERARLVKSQKK
jgi:HK97 gp10 family phage protein